MSTLEKKQICHIELLPLDNIEKIEKEVPILRFLSREKISFIKLHVNSPYETSIDERLIFYNITRCYSDGECCHVFAIAAGDIIKYQGGHMMRSPMRVRFDHVRRRSTAMADMTHDLATLNSK